MEKRLIGTFKGKAKKFKLNKEHVIGFWDDGVMIHCDLIKAYHKIELKEGQNYLVTVEKVKNESK